MAIGAPTLAGNTARVDTASSTAERARRTQQTTTSAVSLTVLIRWSISASLRKLLYLYI